MNFRWRYRASLLLLLGMFSLVLFAIFNVFNKPAYFFTFVVLLSIAVLLVVALVYLWERQLHLMEVFFLGAKHNDFTQGFSKNALGRELADALNTLANKFQQDMSGQRAEVALLTTIIRQAPIAIITFDTDGRIHIFNNAAAALLDIKAPGGVNDIVVDGTGLHNILSSTASKKNTVKITQDGIALNLKFSATKILLLDSEQTVVTIENIGREIHQAEYEAWRNLIGVLTHEIMNSITPIVSLADSCKDILSQEALLESSKDALAQELNDVRKGAEMIANRSQGIMNFVDGYRRLSKVPLPQKQVISLQRLFDDFELLYELKLAKKSIEFTIVVNPSDLKINADRQLIEQVLINLINNAIDACDEGGKICILAKLHKSNVLLEVDDNGCGMETQVATQVFTPFYTTKREGTGIGMSLVRQIMHAHGGQVALESTMNKGTKVSLVF